MSILSMAYPPCIVSSPTFMFADDIAKAFHFERCSDDYATLQNDLNLLHERVNLLAVKV